MYEINRNGPGWPTTTRIVALFIDLAGVLDTVTVGRIKCYIYIYNYVLMCLNIYSAYFDVKIQEININTQHNINRSYYSVALFIETTATDLWQSKLQ